MSDEEPKRFWHYPWWWAGIFVGCLLASAPAANQSPFPLPIEITLLAFGAFLGVNALAAFFALIFWLLEFVGVAERMTARNWLTLCSVLVGLSLLITASRLIRTGL